jgi:hypothetical protein
VVHLAPKPEPEQESEVSDPKPEPCTLTEAHAVFRKRLGDGYDQDAINTVLAAAARGAS